MLKRIWATILVFVTVIGLFPTLPVSNLTAFAEEYTEGYYTYEVTDGEATITDVDETISGDITIPSTLGSYPVTSIGYEAFDFCSSLRSVIIPNTVTDIGEHAFAYCSFLEKIDVPDSILHIGDDAFYDTAYYNNSSNWESDILYVDIALIEAKDTCQSAVSIKNGTTVIADGAFYFCDSLNSVSIPNTVKSIGEGAFYLCDSIDSIVIPESVILIGDRAFSQCESLNIIVIPNTIESIGSDAFYNTAYYNNKNNWENDVLYIGSALIQAKENLSGELSIKKGTTIIADHAFYWCEKLTSVTIPDDVTVIGDYVFGWCTSLTIVNIPDSVTSIGDRLFENCTSMTNINVDASNSNYSSSGGVLFNKNKTTLICYPSGKSGAYSIPDSVTSIGDYAFYDCCSLTIVNIPTSVTSIGDYAFCSCDLLSAMNIPDSVISIGERAFYNSDSLISVTIGNNVASIGDYAFNSCDILTDVKLSQGITSIGNGMFMDCWDLEHVTIPDSVKTIESKAFWNCPSLTEITIPKSVISIADGAFYNAFGDGDSYSATLKDVFYLGTKEEWNSINIDFGNDSIDHATIHFLGPVTVTAPTGTTAAFSDNAAYSNGTEAVDSGEVILSIAESSNGNTLVSALGANAKDSNKAYEISLKDSDGNKVTMTSGSITITLPFPADITSANYKDYDFALYHFTDGNKYEKLNTAVNENGITFTSSNFSPFLLTYEKKPVPTTTTTTTTTTKATTTTTTTTKKPTTTTTTTKKPTTTTTTTKATTTAKPTTTTTKPTTTTTQPTVISEGVVRIAGGSRTQTAVAISKKAFSKTTTVILADGNGYADSLAGVPLAYALNAPILLVRNSNLDADTKAEITRLGAKKVIILGGELAISNDVVTTLRNMGITVERIAGKSRFDTAVEIAKKLEQVTGKKPTEVFFAYSHNYADALSIGGVAAVKKVPILYIAANGVLSDGTKTYLQSSGAKTATILGGTLAVSADAEGNIKKAGATTVSRVFGQSRYATCIEINKKFASVLTGNSVCVATGTNFPDALAGGVFAAKNSAPLVLVPSKLTNVQTDYIKAETPASIYIFGGATAVSSEIENQLKSYIKK